MLLAGDERRGASVDLDVPALRGPLAAVPDAGELAHGLVVREREPPHHALQVAEHADGRVVHVEHDQVLVPLEVLAVVRRRRVERQVDMLLAPAGAVHEDVGVQKVRLPRLVAQDSKLNLQWVGSFRHHLRIHIQKLI